jgi:hypothetical protein
MGVLGGLLGSAGRAATANGGIGAKINARKESNRRDDQNDRANEQNARQEKSAKIKNKLSETSRLGLIAADKNQSDETRINAANQSNELNEIHTKFTSIDELEPVAAEYKKLSNLIIGSKGQFTPSNLGQFQSQLTQIEVKSGEVNEVLRGQIEAGRASLGKKQNTEIDFLARNIANSADGGKNSPQQIADFTRLKGKLFAGGDKEISNRVNKRASEFRKQKLGSQKEQSIIDKNLSADGGRRPSDQVFASKLQEGTLESKAFAENQLKFKRENAFASPLAKDVAKEVEATRAIIDTAKQSANVLNNAKSLMDSKEGIFSGFGANFKLGTTRFIDAVGLQVGDEKIINTQTFQNLMGNQTLAILGSGSLGAGTGISDNDRAFAERIAGGLITLDDKSIRKTMDLNQRLNQSRIIMARRRQALAQERVSKSSFFVEEPDWSKVKNIPGIGQVWIDPKAKNQTPDLGSTGLGGNVNQVANTTKQDRDARRKLLLQKKTELEQGQGEPQ